MGAQDAVQQERCSGPSGPSLGLLSQTARRLARPLIADVGHHDLRRPFNEQHSVETMKEQINSQPRRDPLQVECAVRAALDVIKGRWKPSILFALKDKARRFSEIQAALVTVSSQALTAQLKQLEADGIIERTLLQEVPVRVEYRMTEFGGTLSKVLDQLDTWGNDYLERVDQQDSERETT